VKFVGFGVHLAPARAALAMHESHSPGFKSSLQHEQSRAKISSASRSLAFSEVKASCALQASTMKAAFADAA
jgi:hypothetical protein